MGNQDRQAWVNYRDNNPNGGGWGNGGCGVVVLGFMAGAIAVIRAAAKGLGWV